MKYSVKSAKHTQSAKLTPKYQTGTTKVLVRRIQVLINKGSYKDHWNKTLDCVRKRPSSKQCTSCPCVSHVLFGCTALVLRILHLEADLEWKVLKRWLRLFDEFEEKSDNAFVAQLYN